MARNVYYTYDFEANKNLSHSQNVLFYGTTVHFDSQSMKTFYGYLSAILCDIIIL